MSITKDFETRIDLAIPRGYNIVDVDNLLIHTRSLEVMLKKYQHSTGEYMDQCLCCNGFDPNHDEACQLAKLLDGVK